MATLCTCFYLMIIRSESVEDGTIQLPIHRRRKQSPEFNPLDLYLRRQISKPIVNVLLRFHWIEVRKAAIRDTLYALLLAMSDVQLASGIAMLTAAIIKLHRGSISVYHFSMVTNLTWFSSSIHLLTLLGIRTKVVGSMKKGCRWGPAARGGADVTLRILLMLLMASLLLYCCYVSGAAGLYSHYHCPAKCALGKEKGGVPLRWTILNFVLVIQSYLEACLILCPPVCHWWIDKARHWLVDNRGLEDQRKEPCWRRMATIPFYLMTSEAIKVLQDGLLYFTLGIYWTFDDRISMHNGWRDYSNIADEDDIEGFGQLVPILLIGVPLIQALETYCGKIGSDLASQEYSLSIFRTDSPSLDYRREEARQAQRNSDEPAINLGHLL